MKIDDPKYLEDTFIIRCANYDPLSESKLEFCELPDTKVINSKEINKQFGEYEVRQEMRGSIIYKCTPIFIIETETVLKEIK